jgi:hypothetical protein
MQRRAGLFWGLFILASSSVQGFSPWGKPTPSPRPSSTARWASVISRTGTGTRYRRKRTRDEDVQQGRPPNPHGLPSRLGRSCIPGQQNLQMMMMGVAGAGEGGSGCGR